MDIVVLANYANQHAPLAIKALKAGRNVFSELLPVQTMAEAVELVEAVEASDKLYIYGENCCYMPAPKKMRKLFACGAMGEFQYGEGEYLHNCETDWHHHSHSEESHWRNHMSAFYYCTHSLGPLLRITDEDLRQVSCMDTGAWVMGGEDEHDLMTAHFHAPSGLVVRFTASFINNAGCGHHSYRVYGSEGYFERLSSRGQQKPITTFNSKKLYGFDKSTIVSIEEQRPEFEARSKNFGGHGGADFVLWYDFVEALKANGPAPIPLKEGLRMTIPGIFARESAKQGGKLIDIAYPWD
jgi:predicted dehydrogenase